MTTPGSLAAGGRAGMVGLSGEATPRSLAAGLVGLSGLSGAKEGLGAGVGGLEATAKPGVGLPIGPFSA